MATSSPPPCAPSADYRHAVRLLRPPSEAAAEVVAVSALERQGIDALWQTVARRIAALEAGGALERRRADQARAHLWSEIGEGLMELFKADAKVTARLARLEAEVASGAVTPTAAAQAALQAFRGRSRPA